MGGDGASSNSRGIPMSHVGTRHAMGDGMATKLSDLAPTPCKCGGGCMMCDDRGMVPVRVRFVGGARADLLGTEGYVTDAIDNAWGEVEVSRVDRAPVYVHFANVEVAS